MFAPRAQADPQGLIDLGQQAYELLPLEEIGGRSAALLDIGYAYQGLSDTDAAYQAHENAVRLGLSGGNYYGAVIGAFHQIRVLHYQGQLHRAAERCRERKVEFEGYFEHPVQDLPAIATLDEALGCILLEWNDLDGAESTLRKGLEVGQWMPREELGGYLALARLQAIREDREEMFHTLRRLEKRWPDIAYCTEALKIEYELKFAPNHPETLAKAAAWAKAHPPVVGEGILAPGIGPAWGDEADYAFDTAWVRVQLALGHPTDAVDTIQPLLAAAVAHDLQPRVIELLNLRAQAESLLGKRASALETLTKALVIAEPEGFIRSFDQGPLMVQLLKEALGQGIAAGYVRRLLTAIIGQPGTALDAQKATSPDLVEQLSNREIEVLELLAQGLSSLEVANRLYLSKNTLKAHTQNIYSKLDVHTRVQAVNKARELGLI
jgi:LuxR family maltose regulon positive regulatory protein